MITEKWLKTVIPWTDAKPIRKPNNNELKIKSKNNTKKEYLKFYLFNLSKVKKNLLSGCRLYRL